MTYFDLKLTPNRSLDPRAMPWVIGAAAVVLGLAALRFALIGAWLVLPFLAIDVALLAWALKASYRSGRAVETIRLAGDALEVRRIDPAGAERCFTFAPLFTRVQLESLGPSENRLWLAGGGRRLRIGWFLSPGERREIHAVIADGLDRYRQRRPSASAMP